MNYQETLDFLYTSLPMFQRQGKAAYKADLSNTIALCSALNDPQNVFRSIHVGGTNGKGSSAHMIAAILQAAGYKTGLYTSPHLKDFTERIKIDGQPVPEQFVVDFVSKNKPILERIQPSFFEMTVAMAFQYFEQELVDFAVIEVGMGGRLDSTNIIKPKISLITNIGLDHQTFLGDTLQQIAIEKAGIIKPDTPVVIGSYHERTAPVFNHEAADMSAKIYYAEHEYKVLLKSASPHLVVDIEHKGVVEFVDVKLGLKGIYQLKNLPGVLQTITLLKDKGLHITKDHIREGLENVVELTGLKGRWQVLSNDPKIVCDTGHNEDGVEQIVEQLKHETYEKLFIVWGMVSDKLAEDILKLLPDTAYFYFTQPKIPRAMDVDMLAGIARNMGFDGEIVRDVNDAINKAKAEAGPKDMIFIGGSTFVVAEIDDL